MGRRMPSETIPPFQPSLALPLVAGVAILASLCASHHRKSPAKNRLLVPPPIHESSKNSNQEFSPPNQPCKTPLQAPAKPGLQPSLSASKRKLSMSLSVRIPEGLQRIKMSKREIRQEKDEEEEEEEEDQESLWKKTIILGDRCRIPSDEEGEAVVFDQRGNRVRNYRPRTPRSLPVSRSNSFMSSSDV